RFNSACVIGADHVKSKKNCQDAVMTFERNDLYVAFVADGCGDAIDSPYSEVGSRFGVTAVVNYIVAKLDATSKWRWNRVLESSAFWNDVQIHTLEKIDDAARGMGGNFAHTVIKHFLFTLVGMVVTPDITLFVGIGDGYYFLNGKMYLMIPDAKDNMPTYIAYNMVETSLKKMSPEELKMKVRKICRTDSINSAMIATDGLNGILVDPKKFTPGTKEAVGGPEQFWTKKEYFDNKFSMGWRLNQLASEKRIIVWDEGRVDVQPAIITDDLALVVASRF
ncbi:MAG: protein phosphatase 2C domain-containing protein, partial [Chlorobiales bacterium]|nr:protein phosphatase 2C domain-containing protein [Chlorobiales bacterium]